MSDLTVREVGPYQITGLLGRGGMGVVYKAVHVHIGRRVAIKVLHAHDQPELAQRFLNEARATSHIEHPGIVSIYDAGALPDGRPYLIMEYLAGESLSARMLGAGMLPIKEVLRLGQQMAEPLAMAHSKGIIHRDVKPQNVILVPDPAVPGGERAKLLDFGIAKLAETFRQDWETTTLETQEGVLMGTPAYMPPEQWAGANSVNDRADVYSLGVVLYQMLAGRLPFSLAAQHLTEAPPPLEQLRPDTPAALSGLVHSMLAKSPGERPSMSACAAMLSGIQAAPASPDDKTLSQPAHIFSRSVPPRSGVMRGVMDRLGTVFLRRAATVAPDPGETSTLLRCLPSSLSSAAPEIQGFLLSLFTSYEFTAPGVLHLCGRRGGRHLGGEDYDCFAIFIGEEHGAHRALGAQTFARHASPLEQRLRQLDRDQRKLILVVTDTLELGRGVHAKILDYHTEYNATILPCYIGEIRKAKGDRARALVARKLTDLHTRGDPFAGEGAIIDPLRFIGMSAARNDLLRGLRRQAFIAFYGPPASGKTALLNRIEYELPDRRFVSVPCRGLSAPVEVAAAIVSRLEVGLTTSGPPTPGTLAEEIGRLQGALRQATALQPMVLWLDDADLVTAELENAGTEEARAAAYTLFRALAELAQPGVLCVVVIAVHSFLLGERQLGGRDNPLSARIHRQRVGYLSRADTHELIDRLGGETRVRFSAAAIGAIHRLSAGHVDTVRVLCSRILEQRTEQERTLSDGAVSKAEVMDAAQELAGFRHTFEDSLLLGLTPAEREVLTCVAHHRPHLQRALLARIGQRLPAAAATRALDHLHKLRLVRRTRGRLQVSIPLLRDWLLSTSEVNEEARDERQLGGWMLAGAMLSAAMFFRLSAEARIVAFLPLAIAAVWTFRKKINRPTQEAPLPPLPDALPPLPPPASPDVSPLPPQPMTLMEHARRPVRVFLSYANEDEVSRAELERFLTVPIKQGVIELWHEHRIEPGRAWSQEIAARLAEADIILVLVSQHYLSSNLIWSGQLEPALERHRAGAAVVVPILLRDSDWRSTILGDLWPLPGDGKAILSLPNQDKAWTDVKERIWEIAKRLRTQLPLAGVAPGVY